MHAEEPEGVSAIAGNDRLDLRGSISDRRMHARPGARSALAQHLATGVKHYRVAIRS
jgi:hypothetical protein